MTKSIIELADAYAYEKALVGVGVGADKAAKSDIHTAVRRTDAARAALVEAVSSHRASILQELTGEMPKPVGAVYTLNGVSHCTMTKALDDTELHTATQMREYAAGLVAKAVAAEREQCAALCEHLSARACDAGDCADSIREQGNV
jgi:hypothetical protein